MEDAIPICMKTIEQQVADFASDLNSSSVETMRAIWYSQYALPGMAAHIGTMSKEAVEKQLVKAIAADVNGKPAAIVARKVGMVVALQTWLLLMPAV